MGAQRTQFDLALHLRDRNDELVGFFEYSTDLFNRKTIEPMVGHFPTLLESIVINPAQSIATLPILTGPNGAKSSSNETTQRRVPEG